LERLTNDPRFRRDFSMRDARDFLEGHVPAYHPAQVTELTTGAEVVLLEAFVCADDQAQAGLCLALESLPSSAAGRWIEVMMHHLGTPHPDPLECRPSKRLARAYDLRQTPALFINGHALDLEPETLLNPDAVVAAVAKTAVETVPNRLLPKVRQQDNRTYQVNLTIDDAVTWAADRCTLYLVERACLLVSANQIWLQPHVVRHGVDSDPVDTRGRQFRWTLDLDEIEAGHRAYVKSQ
jgi:hypothetical protein